jgi:hypothetical protein
MARPARLELATLCLEGVNVAGTAECDGQLQCSVFFMFCGLGRSPGFLLSAMVPYLAVHQIVHQVCLGLCGQVLPLLSNLKLNNSQQAGPGLHGALKKSLHGLPIALAGHSASIL